MKQDVTNEQYITAISQFSEALQNKVKYAEYTRIRNKASIFDYFKGLPSLFKPLPSSFMYYMNAKKGF